MFGTILSGMSTSMFEISVVSNNVANAGTTAFKKSNASFADLYSGSTPETVTRTSTGVGSIVEQTRQSSKQGGMMERDGVLNMALAGNGLFVTTTPNPDGTPSEVLSFTRDGEFMLDQDGVLRSSTNDIVYGYDGLGGTELQALSVPYQDENGVKLTALEIASDGRMMATYGSEAPKLIGQLAIAVFPNTTALRQLGMSRFQESQEAGNLMLGVAGQEGFGSILTGTLESSNVDLTSEMTSMIRAQQQFSGSSRILQTYTDMVEKLTR
ncbi:flagellar hook-basal body protein [Planktotalea arctica]|uniref:flagellar hook-basal body protein n=1 Tax=Planktotalea arctica TaxID=1481893 RepID=UPI000A17144E|nr:flagellar hook basal-body protein [Planktotalea arctica]